MNGYNRHMTLLSYFLIVLAAMAAGAINALAGGGTLITFPTLIGLGLPPVGANVTNTVALLPGYLGALFAQSKDLKGQGKRLSYLVPAGIVGGLLGGLLLLNTSEKLFSALIPWLILLASLLLAVQEPIKAWVLKRARQNGSQPLPEFWTAFPVGLAGIYGGYFGAGLSVIVLAVLGLVIDENLTRLNAVKQFIGFVVNTSAAVLFVFSGQVQWPVALVMMIGAIIGGVIGGKLAGTISPATLRTLVVTIGIVVAIIYFIK